MSTNDRALLRRIESLEQSMVLARRRALDLHEYETLPACGTSADYVATHTAAQAYGVWVVPLKLRGPLEVRRVSAAIDQNGAGSSGFALALYKRVPSPFNRDDPIGGSRMQLQLLQFLGQTEHGTAYPSDARFNVDLRRGITLDPHVGDYFIGYQSSDDLARWFCPSDSASKARQPARKTSPYGLALGDFPERLEVQWEGGYASTPWLVLRSPEGVFLYGDPVEDD